MLATILSAVLSLSPLPPSPLPAKPPAVHRMLIDDGRRQVWVEYVEIAPQVWRVRK